MIRLIIFIIVIYFAYRGVRSWIRQLGMDRPAAGRDRPEIDDEMVQDPQCGIYVPRRDAIGARVGGQNLYFCSETCKNRYIDAVEHKKD